jgi:SAM-dependent methyltransferase
VAPLWIVAAAAYAPLGALPAASVLTSRDWPDPIKALLLQQIVEPRREAELRPTIPALTAIDDAVSIAVREQYEENPYPRWANLPRGIVPDTIENSLRTLFPSVRAGSATGNGCDVLIAGCGTGHQAIQAALQYRGARVLAVDLSLASLAYAKRKTQELGMTGLDYAQADLLKLGMLDRRFDIIESGGVLHHLDDPFAGWRVLVDLLRPGAFMYVGLYSALGRQAIVAARAAIAERGYRSTNGDIRRFRQEVMAGAYPEVGKLWQVPDFFSMSGCRDLCFHVQEHRLTIPQLKAFIETNGLSFLGFVVDPHLRQEVNAGAVGDDLDRWHAYETKHPTTFAAQYHFWLQKRR